jgi:hypothetical protein
LNIVSPLPTLVRWRIYFADISPFNIETLTMNPPDRHPRRRRTFRLESLEDRSLLSAMVPHLTAEVGSIHGQKVVVVVGQIKGAIGFLNDPTKQVNVALIGPGTTNGFGRISYDSQHLVALITGQSKTLSISNGAAAVVSPRFGTIYFTYTGTETVVAANRGNLSFSGPIVRVVRPTGGVVTGSFTATGTQNPKTGRFTLNYSMTLNM